MNLIQIIASNSSCSKHKKAQNVTLLFVREPWYNMASKMAAKEEWFYGFRFYTLINHWDLYEWNLL